MKTVILQTPLLYYDVENLNGRIYPKKVVEEIVENFQKEEPLIGQFGYPSEDTFGKIDLEHASHEIVDIYINEDKKALMGMVKILHTPMGDVVTQLLDADKVCFRPRGVGEVNENKEIENYTLITFDAVAKNTDAFGNI